MNRRPGRRCVLAVWTCAILLLAATDAKSLRPMGVRDLRIRQDGGLPAEVIVTEFQTVPGKTAALVTEKITSYAPQQTLISTIKSNSATFPVQYSNTNLQPTATGVAPSRGSSASSTDSTSATASPTASASSKPKSQTGITAVAIGGIVAGSVLGIFTLGLAAFLVRRRVNRGRGNTEPFWRRGGHNNSDMLAAPTTNAYDPNAAPVRDPVGRRNRYQPVYSEASPLATPLPSPGMAQISPGIHDLDFGFPGAENRVSHQPQQGYYDPHAPTDQDPRTVSIDSTLTAEPYKDAWKQGQYSPPRQPAPVEIGEPDMRTSADLYEVEGDTANRESRWSNSITRAFRRGSPPGGPPTGTGMRDF